MNAVQLPDDFAIQAELREQGIETEASEVHGLVSGWLAAGGKIDSEWLQNVLVDENLSAPDADSQLTAMVKITQAQFKDPEFGFHLLLPEDDEALSHRAQALFQWCNGFVAGFGLAGGSTEGLSDDGNEAFTDLINIGRAGLDESQEQDEDAFVEIEEYIRVAALLLHSEVSMARDYRSRLN